MNDLRSNTPSFARLFLGYPSYWACQAGGWTGAWIITLLHLVTEPGHKYEPAASLHSAGVFLSLAAFSHLYRVFIKMNNWRALGWPQLLPRAVTGAFVIAIAHALIVSMILSRDLARISGREIMADAHVALFALGNLVLISAWSAVYFGYHFQVDFQKMQVDQLRLQVALREAEHRALSAQVNPHFLFNSLNTVRALIDESPEKAREAVTQLARVFRASLNTSRKDLITLREEMETVRAYLSLERARFEDQLIIRDDIPDDVLESRLPPFLLQTLIENAIKYGVGNKPSSEISYGAHLDENGLNLRVTNPGRLISSPQITTSPARNGATRVGLENSRLRLQLLFGPHAFLHLTCLNDSVIQAEALIPQLKPAL
jgi:two-component system, LytTR family, sensor kinase